VKVCITLLSNKATTLATQSKLQNVPVIEQHCLYDGFHHNQGFALNRKQAIVASAGERSRSLRS